MRLRGALALLALVLAGCAGAPVQRLRLPELAVAPEPAALQAAQLVPGKAYAVRLLPAYGPIIAVFAKVRAVGPDGAPYAAEDLATAWDLAGQTETAQDMRRAAFLSERLSPVLFAGGAGVLLLGALASWGPGGDANALLYTGAGLALATPLVELTSHELFANAALKRHARWLAGLQGRVEDLPSDVGALARSAVLPGWGQWRKGDRAQAVLLFLANAVGVGLLADLQGEDRPGRIGYMAGAYAFNLLDAWFSAGLLPASGLQGSLLPGFGPHPTRLALSRRF